MLYVFRTHAELLCQDTVAPPVDVLLIIIRHLICNQMSKEEDIQYIYASATRFKDHQITWGHSLIYQQIADRTTLPWSLKGYSVILKVILRKLLEIISESGHQVPMTMRYIYADTLNKSYPYRKSCQSCLPRWDWSRWHICSILSDECMASECGDVINPRLMQLLNSAGIIEHKNLSNVAWLDGNILTSWSQNLCFFRSLYLFGFFLFVLFDRCWTQPPIETNWAAPYESTIADYSLSGHFRLCKPRQMEENV